MSNTDETSTAPVSTTAETTQTPSAEPANPPKKAAAGAGFGLVFQAPDLSDVPVRKPRPRRESPAEPKEESAPSAATHGPPSTTDPEATASRAPEAPKAEQDRDTEPDEGDGASKNRRRKRGGKGRRGRGQGSDGNGDGTDADSEDESQGSDDEQDSNTARATKQKGSGRGGDDSGKGAKGAGGKSAKGGGGKGQPKNEGTDSSARNDGATPGETSSTAATDSAEEANDEDSEASGTRRRRRRRGDSPERTARDEVTAVRGSTRLEAKRQRRREGRETGRRRTVISEAEFLARRESVDRVMVVRGLADRTQIGVLEDGVLVEHYVSQQTQSTTVGNVYLGRVQNVLPSMEAAFVDIGKGRNAVLYAGEVNWDAAGLEVNQAKRIENALTSGESVLVQVTKDPIGHKGARLTSQVSLPGRFLVYVPGNSMTGISRKLPDTERARLKKILKEVVPPEAGVIVRTAAEGASEADLRADVERLTAMWDDIQAKATTKSKSANGPVLLHGEPEMTVRVIRDVFNEDFNKLTVSGDQAWTEVSDYIDRVAPDLSDRVEKWTGQEDVFTHHRIAEALAKAMDRKVWLPSGGSLVIDRTEAMTVVDVNTGKFVGSGGNLEETVTKNNIEAAEEIVRQLRLRDIGGIIVIDFIDMVLESNRDLVVRRLLECLGRDRTKHQVAEVTSLGLVQMTRKRVGAGLIEVFGESCVHCQGRGLIVHGEPIEKPAMESSNSNARGRGSRKGRGGGSESLASGGQGNGGHRDGAQSNGNQSQQPKNPSGPTPAQIAAAAHAAALNAGSSDETANATAQAVAEVHVESETSAGTEPDGPSAALETSPPSAESADNQAQATPARPRRKRGRVVAPAGPPTAGSTEDA